MSFSFSPGMGPRGAIGQFGQEGKNGRFFNKNVVLGMLQFVRPYRRKMILATFFMFLVTGFTLLTPYLIKVAIDNYIAVGNADFETLVAALGVAELVDALQGEGPFTGRREGVLAVHLRDGQALGAEDDARPRRGAAFSGPLIGRTAQRLSSARTSGSRTSAHSPVSSMA